MPKCAHFIGACLIVTALVGHAWSQAPQPRRGNLNVGEAAPDFTLKDVEGERTVTLSRLRGQPVVLIFGSCT